MLLSFSAAANIPMNSSITYSIIIVTYNSAATIGPCLASVLSTLHTSDSVVIVDNNSRDKTLEIVGILAAAAPSYNLTIIANKENLGFSVATNQGVAVTASTYIVLLNPDTMVPPSWLEQLSAHFSNQKTGAVGPVSNYAFGRQSVACHWRGALPEGNLSFEEAASLLHDWNSGSFEETELLIGFCLMLCRDIVERLGCLDERLYLGNDDLELSWRLRLHGHQLLIATDVFVYHEGQHSFNTEPSTVTGKLVQDSSDALYNILESSYGADRVPPPDSLWGIHWFSPANATYNCNVNFHQVIHFPTAYIKPSEPLQPLVSIIMLTYNQLDFTKECFAAIKRNTLQSHEIIVIDNASSDGTRAWLEAEAATDSKYRLILNQENRGFAAGCNQGLAISRGKFLVLLNNDVVVTPDWLTGLLECLQAEPCIGIVGPTTNNASGIQGICTATYNSHQELDAFAAAFRKHNRYRRVPSQRLVGFCVCFTKSLYQEIGGLDEQFGTGNYEDDDYCLRASIAGYRNYVAGDVYVHHHGSISFKAAGIDYQHSITQNGKLFQEKWSRPVESPEYADKIAACRAREDATILLLLERVDEAALLLQAACRDYADDIHLLHLYGSALAALGRTADALNLFPAGSAMRLALEACLHIKHGNYDSAERLLVTASVLDRGLGAVFQLRGTMAVQRGELAFASELLLKGFQLAPTEQLHSDTIKWLLNSGYAVQLLEEVEQAFKLYPQSRFLAQLLVLCSDFLGLSERTLTAAEQYILYFGLDELALSAGISARRLTEPWCPPSASGQSISLCMIVKDEEQNIARCLASFRPVVNEIIVVDTGSLDHTAAIAEMMGARVIHHEWKDDFSEARNVSLSVATCEWIMVMDADEVLAEADYDQFRQLINEHADQLVAFTLETRNYTNNSSLENWRENDGVYPDESGAGWTPSSKLRLWRNMSTIRFANPVHELVENSAKNSGLAFHACTIPVHHYGGLDKNRSAAKDEMYYRLGIKKLQQSNDNDARALYELAVQASGIKHYDEAQLLFKRVIEKEPHNYLGWFNLGYALLRSHRFEESIDASKYALHIKPNMCEAMVNSAIAQLCVGRSLQALQTVESMPHSVAGQLVLAAIVFDIGQPDRGTDILLELSRQRIFFSDFMNNLAETLCEAGNNTLAKQLLEILINRGWGDNESEELLRRLFQE